MCGHRRDGEGPSRADDTLITGHVVNLATPSPAAVHFEEHGFCILSDKLAEQISGQAADPPPAPPLAGRCAAAGGGGAQEEAQRRSMGGVSQSAMPVLRHCGRRPATALRARGRPIPCDSFP